MYVMDHYNNIRKQKILILVHLYYDLALFIYSAQSVH